MSEHPIASLTGGRLRGRRAGAVDAFLGIPYAAAPTGDRRWAAPQPAPSWSGVREADAFGPAAPQPDRPIGIWSHGPTPATAEDCLSLNVWAPARPAPSGRPVLVWIHGGGWALGFSGSEAFAGDRLAAVTGAVVVTLNYRLGSLGWLNHPELGANWGLRDQALALIWVRENIAAFDGDPAAVTLSGQSAGAGSALHLLASPLGEGLFTRVIAQSPPMGELTVPAQRGSAWAQALGEALGGLDLDALRAAPAERVVAAHEALLATDGFRGTRGGAMPVPDPDTLPEDPRAVPSARPALPVLIGTTTDEATFLFRAARRLDPDEAQLQAIVAHLPDVAGPEAADELIAGARASGGEADNVSVLCRLATRQLFAGPVEQWAQTRAGEGGGGGEVYRYRVEHRSPRAELGATHTIDVPLVFGTHATEVGRRVAGDGPAADAVSRAMMAAWREFIHGRAPWDAGRVQSFG